MKTIAKEESLQTQIKKFVDSKTKLAVSLVPSNAVKTIVNMIEKQLFCITTPEKKKISISILEEDCPEEPNTLNLENSVELNLSVPHLLWETNIIQNNKLTIGEVVVNEIDYKNKTTVKYRPWIFPNVHEEGRLCFGTYTPTDLRKAYNHFYNSPFNLELTDHLSSQHEDRMCEIVNELFEDTDKAEDINRTEEDKLLTKKEKTTLIKDYNSSLKKIKEDLVNYYREPDKDDWAEDSNYFGLKEEGNLDSEADNENIDPSYIVFEKCDGIFLSDSKLIPENFKTEGTATGWITYLKEDTWEVTIYKNKQNQTTFTLPKDRLNF